MKAVVYQVCAYIYSDVEIRAKTKERVLVPNPLFDDSQKARTFVRDYYKVQGLEWQHEIDPDSLDYYYEAKDGHRVFRIYESIIR